jgi:hypothetical protein
LNIFYYVLMFFLCGVVDPHLVSMRIPRIQGAKPMRIHADSDPGQTLKFKVTKNLIM